MHPIAVFDGIFFTGFLVALIFLLHSWKRIFQHKTRLLFPGLIIFMLFYSSLLFVEWVGLTSALDVIEDYIGAVVPMWWAFLFYGFLQELMHTDLRKNEERLNLALEGTNDGIWDYYPQDSKVYYSPRYFTMLGYEPDELPHTNETWKNLLHPDDRPSLEGIVKRFLENKEEFYSAEFRMRTKEGGWRWISSRGKAVGWDEEGNIRRMIGTHTDISTRKNVEEELRKSEQKYRQLFEFSRAINIIVGTDGIIKDVNKAMLQEYGYSKDEFVGKHALDFIVHDQKEAVRAELEKNFTEGFTDETEVEAYAKDGSIRTILFPASVPVLMYEGDQLTGTLVTGIDITERKRAQEKAKQHEEQLFQASKMVSLGTLVSGVAHEINNPNHFILLNSKIFSRVWDEIAPILKSHADKQEDFSLVGMPFEEAQVKLPLLMSGISDGATSIQKIVKSLKDFSRQDMGRLDHAVDINLIIESSIIIVSNLIKKSTNRFSVDYAKDIPVVKGNPQQLEQVIINLVTNSCQALQDREKALVVTSSYEKETNMVIVRVEDEGAGISPENMKQIMDPFFTTKRSMDGTGLGLSISYTIILNHKGDLSITSEPGKGTRATIMLPVLQMK